MPIGYERVNGEFEHNGEFFKLVKQKLENDTLNIVCIKDHRVVLDTTARWLRNARSSGFVRIDALT